MTVFVSDTFTDTDGTLLTAHTGETGATWTSLKGTAEEIQSNALTPNGNDGVCYASGSPASAEYDVEYVITGTTAAGYALGGLGRLDTGVSTGTYYLAWHTSATFTLYKVIANAFTSLGTSSSPAPVGGDAIKLEIRDAAKKLFVNGSEKISSADNAITGAGKAGVRSYGNVTTVGIDTFVATDAAGGATTIDLTTASFGMTTAAMQNMTAVSVTSQSLQFTAQYLQNRLAVAMSSASLALSANSIVNNIQSFLGSASFNFSGKDITIFSIVDTIINLSCATFNMAAHPIDTLGAIMGFIRRGRSRFRANQGK